MSDQSGGCKDDAAPQTFSSRIERVAAFLQNVTVTLAAVFVLVYYLFPDLTRSIAKTINPDRSYYYVGGWNLAFKERYYKPRFHAGRSGGIPHSEDDG